MAICKLDRKNGSLNGRLLLTVAIALATLPCQARADWPQLQHDARHTGYSPETIEAPNGFKSGWRRSFAELKPFERISRVVQVIAADNKIFVPTLFGNLYALNPADGKTIWRFQSGEPVMHTAAVAGGRVFFATIEGSVFAVDSETGQRIWRWNNNKRTGFSAAVCLADGKVFIGGRDGDFHALDQNTGQLLWSYQLDHPIYQTAAYHENSVYFAAEDMHCYALNAGDGTLKWKSEKLFGGSFRDFYPLIHKGLIILESMPIWHNHGGQNNFGGVKFPLTAWWTLRNERQINWINKYGPLIEKGQIPPEAMKDLIAAQDYQTDYFKKRPEQNLRFTLDLNTGKQPYIMPLAIQSMCGNQPPPAVGRNGMLIMPLRFGRCGWGTLDPETGYLNDIFFEMGEINDKQYQTAHGGCSGDENIFHTSAGPWVFVVHANEHGPGPGKIHGHPASYTGAYNRDRRKWYPLPSLFDYSRFVNLSRATNSQCGGSAASIAYDALYHQTVDTIHCWIPE